MEMAYAKRSRRLSHADRGLQRSIGRTGSPDRMPPAATVAQLDRVPGFEPGGRGFESLRARQSCRCPSPAGLTVRYEVNGNALSVPGSSAHVPHAAAHSGYSRHDETKPYVALVGGHGMRPSRGLLQPFGNLLRTVAKRSRQMICAPVRCCIDEKLWVARALGLFAGHMGRGSGLGAATRLAARAPRALCVPVCVRGALDRSAHGASAIATLR